MKKQLYFGIILMLFLGHTVSAQINDAQLWENINVEKNITQKLSARINQEGRVTENFSRFSFNYFDSGFNYKFNKHIHATIAYVWVEKKQPDDSWSIRHQAYLAFTFRKKFKGFLLSDRPMFLWQGKDFFLNGTV